MVILASLHRSVKFSHCMYSIFICKNICGISGFFLKCGSQTVQLYSSTDLIKLTKYAASFSSVDIFFNAMVLLDFFDNFRVVGRSLLYLLKYLVIDAIIFYYLGFASGYSLDLILVCVEGHSSATPLYKIVNINFK